MQALPPSDFIRDHSSIVSWAIGALVCLILAQAGLIASYLKGKFGSVDTDLGGLRRRIEEVREEFIVRLQKHTEEEERAVLEGMKDIRSSLETMTKENATAHEAIMTRTNDHRIALGERVSSLEEGQKGLFTKMDQIESKLPNGEGTKIIRMLEAVLRGQANTAKG